ncbi:hypothetical protein HRG_009318 [Hirsutella rhossiliensis]|uniref:BTB domain transcription factor n=1 Tax=Hirsutella rhossiliensis TaxID=111463 RepID=A0A9P8SEC8_9HYPO|nr:uncharacterized protein HRG_09318 [Hirsutella rhossiliensis]KAH0959536.1 hypothetical protein HRG_09318 [Hirsutella rhossiliensis]
MVGSNSQDRSDKAEQSASTGEKHQTDHDSSDVKRTKTERQTTLDDSLDNGKEDNAADPRSEKSKHPKPAKEESQDAVQPSEEPHVPSNILEKGIFYFFVRGRVGIDEIEKVDDVARSYILLRPIDKDAKLGEGPIGDSRTTRLMALPKKALPSSGKDRFMAFVEMSSPSYDELKRKFLASDDYETKTAGTRHTPAATPVGEGVYAITTTGRESHLAYMTTLPEKLGSVQTKLGLKDQGSFVLSTKNPQHKGPANARLPKGPEFPEEIIKEFRSLRWLPSRPEHLNYENAQLLLIGESSGLDKAVEPQEEDKENGKEEPLEVLGHLEEEDLERMRHLPGGESESLFADLHAHAKDYPKLQTTF